MCRPALQGFLGVGTRQAILVLIVALALGLRAEASIDVGCMTLLFDADAANDKNSGKAALSFSKQCPSTQQCLFFQDDATASLQIAAGSSTFQVFENYLSEYGPKSGKEILRNAGVVFDSRSTLHIHAVGTYRGANDIGNYLAVPHSQVSNIGVAGANRTSALIYSISESEFEFVFERVEKWRVRDWAPEPVTWYVSNQQYPCSMMTKSRILELPETSLRLFVESAQEEGAISAMCTRIMKDCVGGNTQYGGSFDACTAYLSALPTFDPLCQARYGPLTAKGESLLCKYLHHYMSSEQPSKHCFHAGFPHPDAGGKIKCGPLDCASEAPSGSLGGSSAASSDAACPSGGALQPARCTAQDLEELTAATIYALPFCLPSLGGASCSASNCTQAINTYLGRFVSSGVLCDCFAQKAPSKLLSLLDLDAPTLIKECGGASQLFAMPHCVSSAERASCAHDPNLYSGKSGCVSWDWAKLESGMLREWGRASSLYGRETTSVDVATAECSVLQKLLSLYHNFDDEHHFERHVVSSLLPGAPIFPHPGGPRLVGSHEEVLAAIRSPQRRSAAGLSLGMCHYGAWDQLVDAPFVPLLQSTGTPAHAGSRLLWQRFFPGLHSPAAIVPRASARNVDLSDDASVGDYLGVELFRAAAGSSAPRITVEINPQPSTLNPKP